MPLLPSQYFSNWYVVTLDGKPRILSSFQEQLNQQTSLEKNIQGDIGNHVVSIPAKHYSSSVTCPILLIRPETEADRMYDVFDLILEYVEKIQNPITNNSNSASGVNKFNYVIESSSINISAEGAEVTANLESWTKFTSETAGIGYTNKISYKPEEYNFYARKARFYDIQFGIFGENFLIESATLSFAFANSKTHYLPGFNSGFGSTVPLYSIGGYQVTGNVTLVVKPEQYEILKLYNAQSPGIFNAVKHSLYLRILDRTENATNDKILNLGDFMFMPSVDISITTNNIIKSTINFVTMFRRTSSITN